MAASLDIVKISCTAICVKPAHIYRHITPALRGAFGYTLNRLFDKGDNNPSLYQTLFKNETENTYSDEYVSGKPNPYVFESPARAQTSLSAGDTLTFSLTLFGNACAYVPESIFTIQQMLKWNLMNTSQAFELQSAANCFTGETLYANGAVNSNIGEIARPWRWTDGISPEIGARRVLIRFLEPASIKENGEPAGLISFSLLIRAILNRLRLLTSVYGGVFQINRDEIEENADTVKTYRNELHDSSFITFSRTQMKKKNYHGLTGDVYYEGDLTQFLPYINIGSVLHVGRNTVMGMGQYVWKIIVNEKS